MNDYNDKQFTRLLLSLFMKIKDAFQNIIIHWKGLLLLLLQNIIMGWILRFHFIINHKQKSNNNIIH